MTHECKHEANLTELFNKVNATHTSVKLIEQEIIGREDNPGLAGRLLICEAEVQKIKENYRDSKIVIGTIGAITGCVSSFVTFLIVQWDNISKITGGN